GYREDGDITTPFDMRVKNELDRFHLAKDAANTIYAEKAADFIQEMDKTLQYHHDYIRENGDDISEVQNWEWKDLK
ncbi:MAG: hypothetical protein L0I66_02920, partial [Tetragenococcus halophilus]|nr:hypothetical protein [Tetragenococcus halophilus]